MQAPGPTLTTERLILRPTALGDFDRWADMMADEETARFIGGVQPRPVAWRALIGMAGAWALTGVAMFSVLEKTTERWLGRIGPWQPEGWPGTEVGWALHRDSWGQGLALEAAAACMDYAVDILGWTTIVHTIDPDNLQSIRLAERLGSKIMGETELPAPFEGMLVKVWGQTAVAWKARRSA